MVTKDDLIYRQVFTLKDGARVLVRPLTKDDRQALLDLFLPVPLEDRQFIRDDINDPKVVNGWIDDLDYDRIMPLVAVVGNRIVGNATLHFKSGPSRHRCEVRIFLAKDFRQRGVGSRMIQGLIELAKRRGIFMLEAEIVSDQSHIIKAFQNMGFETKTILEDHFMLADGDLRDVTYLILRLHKTQNEF
jgi:RimJ/RimL family protein N-acetyltransferase